MPAHAKIDPMTGTLDRLATLNIDQLGDAAEAITTLAWTRGVTADPDPIGSFADAATPRQKPNASAEP